MKVVTRQNFGNTLIEELNKLEVSLKDSSVTNGTLLDYGSGIKEYICTVNTRFTKTPINHSGRYIYYDYFTHRLPVTFREVLNVQGNLEGNDSLLVKICTGKALSGNQIRVDFSAN